MPPTEEKKAPALKPDPSIHHEIGDDKGEGGQADIKTDSADAHPSPPPD